MGTPRENGRTAPGAGAVRRAVATPATVTVSVSHVPVTERIVGAQGGGGERQRRRPGEDGGGGERMEEGDMGDSIPGILFEQGKGEVCVEGTASPGNRGFRKIWNGGL